MYYTITRRSQIQDLKAEIVLLKKQISVSSFFIKQIEKGNIDFEIPEDNGNELSTALSAMRVQMKHIAEEGEERNWVTTGMAKFVEILRTTNEDVKLLGDNILSNLVKYIEANQGSLFVVNNEEEELSLEMVSCYAFDRKKFEEKKINIHEGLAGQCFLEKETIHLREVPDNYVHITSGLGQANPSAIVIVPLKINNEVYGLIELASFKPFPKYKIDFLEKLGESIASTISTVKINHKTKQLLEASQIQTEELKAQEEEMRQNMEELQATQEDLQRKEMELKQTLQQASEKEAQIMHMAMLHKDEIEQLEAKIEMLELQIKRKDKTISELTNVNKN
jgi:hypothetical protein